MSHSKRKTPIFGYTTAESEKEDKQKANRKYRRTAKERLREDGGDESIPDCKAVSNRWLMQKDGKSYYREADEKDMRK